MKALENFKNEKNLNLSLIYGGTWITSPSTTSTDENGCAVTTSEQYNDTSGDGKHQKGESMVACISVAC
jgi:hypothetical protein